jgi:hypothetical protein
VEAQVEEREREREREKGSLKWAEGECQDDMIAGYNNNTNNNKKR